jgi:hypothetical protein
MVSKYQGYVNVKMIFYTNYLNKYTRCNREMNLVYSNTFLKLSYNFKIYQTGSKSIWQSIYSVGKIFN